MRVWRRFGPLLAIVLVLNLVPMVAAPSVAVADERPALTYFALGDSYASGHGLQDDGPPCHRSSLAYPYLVRDALLETYRTVDLRHLACSGATAGPNTDVSDAAKSISHQFETVNTFLDQRDSTGGSDPVLVTITIGANDVGLDAPDTWLKVLRSFPTSAFAFFNWLDKKSAPIAPSLTTGVDSLLSHEGVYIVFTDYPNPFAEGVFGGDSCNDFFRTLTCDDAIKRILERLNSIVLDQFIRVKQPGHLRVASLGPSFASHHSTCGVESMPLSQTWFQLAFYNSQLSTYDNIVTNADACFHPNASGAKAIADAVLQQAHKMLPAPVTAQPTQASSEASTANTPDPASGVPTFHLPWEAGSVWQITVGNGQGEHSNPANFHGFDAVPAPGRGTDKVVAVADGTVMDFQESMPDSAQVNSGHAGNCVIIDHGGSVYSIYAHLAQDSVPLSKGQPITSGTVIGTMGNSGFSYAPHLHWAVLKSARMYTDANVSPYQTCTGRTIESSYADPDKELQEDGGIPRNGRYYESFNSPSDNGGESAEPAAPTSVATQEDDELYALHIRADNADTGETTFGAQFIVTTEDGRSLGTCTLEGDENSPPWQYCAVDVPKGIVVSVWEDPETLPDGYAPEENPLTFDTAVPTTTPHKIDVTFNNVPQSGDVSATTPATAQGNGGIVIGVSCGLATDCETDFSVQVSVMTEDGESLGTCTVKGDLRDQSHVPACAVDFPFRPTGTLIVTQDVSTLSGGSTPVENPIYIETTELGRASHDVVFVNTAQDGDATAGQTSDVAIATTENGESVTDVCYVLVDFSNEGCDENGDGKITFQDVPLDTYTVRQTADLGPGRRVEDFTIKVTGEMEDGLEVFSATVDSNSGGSMAPSSSSGAVDISLITRDPDMGDLLTNTCYVLVDYSNEGCDENGDGQVTFEDIPFDTYTVQQTRVPAGYPAVSDFEIDVLPTDYPTGFVVRQASQPNAPDTRNVSVVLIDDATNTKMPMDACVRIGDVSNEGCDRDLIDGQIDFVDVQAGHHDIVVTSLPAGSEVTNPEDLEIRIDPRTDPANLFAYVHISREDASIRPSSPDQAEPFDAFVGEWGRHTARVNIESDGTGEMALYSGCCTGVTFSLEFDVEASPVTATIVRRSFEGDMDPAESAQPGDIITFGFEPGQNGDLLVVNLPASEQRFIQRLEFCAPDGYDERCGA